MNLIKFSVIIFSSIFLISCGNYRNVSYYNDPIYGRPDNNSITQQSNNQSYYKNYFDSKSNEFKNKLSSINDSINTNQTDNKNSIKKPWGSNVTKTDIYFVDNFSWNNGFYSHFNNFYPYRNHLYRPYSYYGYGNFGFYNNYYNPFFYDPMIPFYDYYSPYRFYGFGFRPGLGYYNGYYNYRYNNYGYSNLSRSDYLSNNNYYPNRVLMADNRGSKNYTYNRNSKSESNSDKTSNSGKSNTSNNSSLIRRLNMGRTYFAPQYPSSRNSYNDPNLNQKNNLKADADSKNKRNQIPNYNNYNSKNYSSRSYPSNNYNYNSNSSNYSGRSSYSSGSSSRSSGSSRSSSSGRRN
jgi:uncharacterized membrane protein YgcG